LTTLGVTENWCVWQSNRTGNWDIWGSYIYSTGIQESRTPQTANFKPEQTVVRDVLFLGALGSRRNTGYRAELTDAAGRKVLDLRPGANDVSTLAPGIYFVRSEPSAVSGKRTAVFVRKVVIQR